jgi:solute carrier family 25 protein 44
MRVIASVWLLAAVHMSRSVPYRVHAVWAWSACRDALARICRYKGFMVNSFSVISSQLYITTYEVMRAWGRARGQTEAVCNLAAGIGASVVQQSVAVPIDVVSQRMMVDRRRDGATSTRSVIRGIVTREGVAGFWKGSAASLLTLAPSSGIFWASYGQMRRIQISWQGPETVPSFGSTLAQQAAASFLAGCFSAACTNPLDIVKTRIQVSGS